jgi:hypothetical protein
MASSRRPPASARPTSKAVPAVAPLPPDFPLPLHAPAEAPAARGAPLPLPPAWVYHMMSRVVPPSASVEVEAVRLVSCFATEFVALLAHQVREREGPGGELGAGAVLDALEELGFEGYAPLLSAWMNKRAVADAKGALAAAAGGAAGGGGGGGGDSSGSMAIE